MTMLQIDRTFAFDPTAFICKGYSIVEQDERSLKFNEVDLTKVSLETMLKGYEKSVVGEEKLKRLIKAGHIRLDAKVFYALLGNQHLIPELWKQPTNGNPTCVFFDGTILRQLSGNRFVLYLYWDGGKWRWEGSCLVHRWRSDRPSAVLKH